MVNVALPVAHTELLNLVLKDLAGRGAVRVSDPSRSPVDFNTTQFRARTRRAQT